MDGSGHREEVWESFNGVDRVLFGGIHAQARWGCVTAKNDRLWRLEMERVWRPFLAASGGQKWPPRAVRNSRS